MPAPLVVINTVGLTSRLLQYAPRLSALAKAGWCIPMRETLPAVTCTAQATMLTGVPPNKHGIVANGWLYRDTNEVRFWQQSNRLIQAEPVYATAKRRAAKRGRELKVAKLFWWFNQGADVDISVTPKPHYGIDGSKVFDVAVMPWLLGFDVKHELGSFPFASFWGPLSGIKSTQWIAALTALTLRKAPLNLLFTYLPHLDYDPQRHGPSGCNIATQVGMLDDQCQHILDAAERLGARVWIVNEYCHRDVTTPVFLNRFLAGGDIVAERKGPFGSRVDLFDGWGFVVCDHQIAHIYVWKPEHISIAELIAKQPGVDRVFIGEQRAEIGLDHPRSGEIIALAKPDAWFAYPFWLDDRDAPDYARTVAIHHKPGFDPCELFFDPKIRFPKLRVARKLLQSKLGFRTKFDVIPLDASIVRGSQTA